MTVWMVRAGRHGDRENFALENSAIVIGWNELPDLSSVKSFDEMKKIHAKFISDLSPKVISNFSGQVWAFVGRIKIGDLVALPLKTRSAIALGKVTGPYNYKSDNPEGAKHIRSVEWIREDTPRDEFAQDLLYSLGAYMTVCQIKRNNAEERIKSMLDGSSDPYLRKEPTLDKEEKEISDKEIDDEVLFNVEQYARDQIRSFISARYKGHELTRLVTSLLKAQGYQSYMSPPGPDGGVDILAGRGNLGFDKPRLCVQVKSGTSPVDVSTLRELQGVMKNYSAEQGLFVSWSGFKESVYRESKTLFFEIRLWDSDKLIDAILENYEKMPDEVQAELPLKRIWTLVQDE